LRSITIHGQFDEFLGVDWSGMVMEIADFSQDGRVISGGGHSLAGDPSENVKVRGFEQAFIVVKFALAEICDLGIGKSAKNEIHFSNAAMPGAEEDALLPDAELQFFTPSPDNITLMSRTTAAVACQRLG
jgi:hypothetical protein